MTLSAGANSRPVPRDVSVQYSEVLRDSYTGTVTSVLCEECLVFVRSVSGASSLLLYLACSKHTHIIIC